MDKPPKDFPVEYTFINEEGVLCCYAKAGWGHQYIVALTGLF